MKSACLLAIISMASVGAHCQDLSNTLKNENRGSDIENDILRAVELYTEDRYDDALKLLQTVVEKDPANAAAYYYLGLAELSSGKTHTAARKALGQFEKACELAPDNLHYAKILANLYSALDYEQDARNTLVKILEKQPDDYETLLKLYSVDIKSSEFSEALGVLNRLETLQYIGGAGLSELKLELYMTMDVDSLGMPYLLDTLARDGSIELEERKTAILGCMKNISAASWQKFNDRIGECMIFLAEESGYKDEDLVRAALSFTIGNNKYTAEMLEVCNAVTSDETASKELKVDVHNALAYYRYGQGDMQGCFAEYEKALFYDPDDALALNNYAYFLSLENKQLDKALKMSEKVVNAHPDEITYIDTYAWILHLKGNDEKANELFRKALGMGATKHPVILDHYADVLLALKKYDLAIYYYTMAKDKDIEGELTNPDEKIAAAKAAKAAKESGKKAHKSKKSGK